MDREFTPNEEALALKELGFNEKCIKGTYKRDTIYSNLMGEGSGYDFNNRKPIEHFVSIPTYSQAFRWFREKGILSEIHLNPLSSSHFWGYQIIGYEEGKCIIEEYEASYNWSYEEAELTCLRKLIEIVKNG